jgi:hypothetical protein
MQDVHRVIFVGRVLLVLRDLVLYAARLAAAVVVLSAVYVAQPGLPYAYVTGGLLGLAVCLDLLYRLLPVPGENERSE